MQRNRYFRLSFSEANARTLIAFILLALLAVPGPLQAQAAAGLNIEIVEGEGAINNLQLRTAREAIVEVQDENHKPVSGALVLFTAKGNSPFSHSTLRATTDATGRVRANPLALHSKPGQFDIQVKATYQGRTARQTIHQRNALNTGAAAAATAGAVIGVEAVSSGAALSLTGILIIAGVAAGGVIGGLFGTGVLGGSGKSGQVSVGAPHF